MKNKKTLLYIAFGLMGCLIIGTALLMFVLSRKPLSAKKMSYGYVVFSDSQKRAFDSVRNENGNASLVIRLQFNFPKNRKAGIIEESQNLPFAAGFITSDQMKSEGKLIKNACKSMDVISVFGNAKDAWNPEQTSVTFDLSIALSKKQDDVLSMPEGFFITSDVEMVVLDYAFVPCYLGFDLSREIPFYGFPSTGGRLDFSPVSFDFTGASETFPLVYSENGVMPEYSLTFFDNYEFDEIPEVSVVFGGETLRIKKVSGIKEISIPTAGLKAPFGKVDLKTNKELVTSVLLKDGDPKLKLSSKTEVLYPVKTDPGLILDWKQSSWRVSDYEIFQWNRFDGILFFDIRNYDIQDNFFRRLAYYVEKDGYRGRLVSDEELKGKHGYNAHDYSAESLTSFFNKVEKENFKLLPEEITLRKILLANGLMKENPDFDGTSSSQKYLAGQGGLVSISRQSEAWLRTNLLAHEGWHNLFFRDEEFRNFTAAAFYTIDPNAREFVIDYFKSQPGLGYDTNDLYLLHNEFMAYIMQQPVSGAANYFVHLAERGSVMKYTPELARYVRETKGRAFEDAALMFEDYVRDRWGITCGNISLVRR